MRTLCRHIFASAERKFNTVISSLGNTILIRIYKSVIRILSEEMLIRKSASGVLRFWKRNCGTCHNDLYNAPARPAYTVYGTCHNDLYNAPARPRIQYKNKVWRAVLSWIFRARTAWWSHLQARRRSLRAC